MNRRGEAKVEVHRVAFVTARLTNQTQLNPGDTYEQRGPLAGLQTVTFTVTFIRIRSFSVRAAADVFIVILEERRGGSITG